MTYLPEESLAILAVPGPARAGEDSDSSNFYDMTFGRLMESIGFQKADGNRNINYQERPPLVLPSSRDLPPPEKAEAVISPAWPKDPDVKRRKLIEQQEKNRIVSDVREREQNPLSPQELAPGPKPRGVQAINTGPGRSGATDRGEILSPFRLLAKDEGYRMHIRRRGGVDRQLEFARQQLGHLRAWPVAKSDATVETRLASEAHGTLTDVDRRTRKRGLGQEGVHGVPRIMDWPVAWRK